ncbi:MAG TPA: polysaccharide biosynthesis C-terminal domain-containing protein [Methylomirabilota bacterium]|nr:polysaccharide biosynthesis C-terminal domain-containing protein [Methylomirabilota bacterium]
MNPTRSVLASVGLNGTAAPILVARILALACGLVTALVSSSSLGAQGRGELVGFAILQLFASTGLGFGTGVAAYVVVGTDRHEGEAVAGAVAAWALVVFLATAAVAAVAGAVGLLDLALGSSSPFIVTALAAGASGQYASIAWTQLVMGLGRSRLTAAGFAIAPVAVCICSMVVASVSPSSHAFMAAQVGGWLAAAMVMMIVADIRPTWRPATLARLVRRGRSAMLGDMANSLVYRLDALLLGLLGGTAAVGVYSLAVQVLEPVWTFASAVAAGLLVTFRDRPERLWAAMTARSAFVVTAVSTFGAIAVLVVLPYIVSIVGSQFDRSIPAAAALAPGIVLLSAAKVLAAFQLASGRLWASSAIATATLVVTIVLDVLLIPSFGALGAAIASSIAYGVAAAAWLIAFRHWSSATSSAAPPARVNQG